MNKLIVVSGLFLLSSAISGLMAAAPAGCPDKDGYLFVYFTGNDISEEAVRYAVSDDGYNFHALNNNRPVLESKTISNTGGVRDPHILRGKDGKTYYMTVTDMISANGWDSNRGITLLCSDDLISWNVSKIDFTKRFSGQDNLKRVWAPQTIYDETADKYMVYFSMKHGDGPDIIYYAYANDDFTDFISEPKVLFRPADKKSCIDGDIVFKDGLYHLFYKTEGDGNGIKKAVTDSLTSGKWIESPDYKQQTTSPVEGSGIFRMNDSDKYILMYDVYMDGAYQFTESYDLEDFSVVDAKVSMDFTPRHGTVMPISRAEMQRLQKAYQNSGSGYKNPVLPEFHADPEILYSENTGKYYIYSTTDGISGWGGTYFTCYSSEDLIKWTCEGIVLDLIEDVKWANGNAWAPAIEEKVIEGRYKYFLYFSGNEPTSGTKQIGVAVADTPVGPFTAEEKPLVTDSPVGYGQQIDVDVFTDPVSGKSYLYWGNGYMAGSELNEDMISIKPETVTVMTPEGGTLEDYEYREAPYVFFRNGKYYFTWSVDDTGAANYHVAYGTSDNPLGQIEVADKPVILMQNPGLDIYGTAHNSILRKPGADDWIIVYHRINPAFLNNNPGVHRQVCIDNLEFNPDGSIKPIILK